jgi:hypothetical protein
MYHMSAVNTHMEGQWEAGSIFGGGERRGFFNVLSSKRLMYFFNTEPLPSGRLLVKQLSLFGFKPEEG